MLQRCRFVVVVATYSSTTDEKKDRIVDVPANYIYVRLFLNFLKLIVEIYLAGRKHSTNMKRKNVFHSTNLELGK